PRCLYHHPPPPDTSTLSLHDALPIFLLAGGNPNLDPETAKSWTFGLDYTPAFAPGFAFSSSFFSVEYSGQVVDLFAVNDVLVEEDRKSTRLNSSHVKISYAVFCLKKK